MKLFQEAVCAWFKHQRILFCWSWTRWTQVPPPQPSRDAGITEQSGTARLDMDVLQSLQRAAAPLGLR